MSEQAGNFPYPNIKDVKVCMNGLTFITHSRKTYGMNFDEPLHSYTPEEHITIILKSARTV